MITQDVQAQLIRDIHVSGGFLQEEFISADGIQGNLKVVLPEALGSNDILRHKFVGHLVAQLSDVEVIAATGGAVNIAQDVAQATNRPLLEIHPILYGGQKHFYLEEDDRKLADERPDIGFIEDVSSTFRTVINALAETGLHYSTKVVAVGLRRGIPAPPHFSFEDVIGRNRTPESEELFEYPHKLEVRPVIWRPLPLWMPADKMTSYLPELSEL